MEKKKTKAIINYIFNDLSYINQELLLDWEVRNAMDQPQHYKKYVVEIVVCKILNELGQLVKLGMLRLTKMGRHKSEINRYNIRPIIEDNVSRRSHIITYHNRIYWDFKEKFPETLNN
jgi:hypothetical protein